MTVERDWKRLPYWGTEVSIDKSLQEIHRQLDRYGIDAVRVTKRRDPWGVTVEWEMPATEKQIPVVVSFEIEVDDSELWEYTATQQKRIPLQAGRLLFHTIKNLLAAVDMGLLTYDEAFLSRFQTWQGGQATTVGKLVLQQLASAGAIGPAIIQKALPAGGKA